ncbi:MAG: hypothetical protein OXC44_07175 [Proteobacteria bacterium]|nr:hypothetical protein [Pseudomonadota bacterium]
MRFHAKRSLTIIIGLLWFLDFGYLSANDSKSTFSHSTLPQPNYSSIQQSLLHAAQEEPTLKATEKIWLRLREPVKNMTIDPLHRKRIAFVEIRTGILKTLHLPSKAVVTIEKGGIDRGFVWSPDGIRLIYRKQYRKNNAIISKLMVYDHYINKHLTIHTLPSFSGYPTLDPRDHQLILLHNKGVVQKRLKLPRSRLARWQMLRGERHGRFAATPKGIMHISPSQRGMKRLLDDNSGLQSYAISRDGQYVVWATKRHGIYLAKDSWNKNNPTPKLIAFGLDPTWSYNGKHILFSGARVVGDQVAGYDIRMINIHGKGSWITHSFNSQERWPLSLAKHHILFTKEKTTDIFSIRTKPLPEVEQPDIEESDTDQVVATRSTKDSKETPTPTPNNTTDHLSTKQAEQVIEKTIKESYESYPPVNSVVLQDVLDEVSDEDHNSLIESEPVDKSAETETSP